MKAVIISKDQIIGLLAVNFRKAFDVINFNILLSKLELYGCNDISLNGSNPIYIIDINEFLAVILFHRSVDKHMVFPKGPYWDPCCLSYIYDLALHCKNSIFHKHGLNIQVLCAAMGNLLVK